AGGRPWGRLIALPIDSPLDDLDAVALERAAALVALALLRQPEEERIGARARGEFLADVASGRLGAGEAAGRAAPLGFPHEGPALLPVAAVLAGGHGPTAAWRGLATALAAQGMPALLGTPVPEEALLVLALRDPAARTEAADA